MHYILFPFLALWFIFITLSGWAVSFLPKGNNRRFHRWVYMYWSRCFFNMFYFREKTHYRNTKPLPKHHILISNHYSGVDTIWLPGKFKVIPLSKSDLKKWPVVSNILIAAGMIFVDRHASSSKVKSIENVKRTLDKGVNVLIFPEGGCHGRYLVPFKDGAFAISKSTGVPIIPAYLYYEDEDTYELKKSEGIGYMMQCLFKRNNRNIHSHLFDALYPEEYETAADMRTAATEIYKKVQSEYK